MFDESLLRDLRTWRADHGIVWEPGLSAAELDRAEQRWDIRFPPDLRALLMRVTSCSKRFIHWSKTPDEDIAWRLDWPRQGFHFDIEHADLWLPE